MSVNDPSYITRYLYSKSRNKLHELKVPAVSSAVVREVRCFYTL